MRPTARSAITERTAAAVAGTATSTPARTIDVKIPKLRQGTYFPEWLLERRRHAEAALTTVVATSYLLAVSTPRWTT